MPVSFQYLNKETNEAVNLLEIDNQICEYVGATPDEKEYHPAYTYLHWMGSSCLCHASNHKTGDGYITDEKSVEAFLDSLDPEDHSDHHKDLMREFFYRRYYFKAWR